MRERPGVGSLGARIQQRRDAMTFAGEGALNGKAGTAWAAQGIDGSGEDVQFGGVGDEEGTLVFAGCQHVRFAVIPRQRVHLSLPYKYLRICGVARYMHMAPLLQAMSSSASLTVTSRGGRDQRWPAIDTSALLAT